MPATLNEHSPVRHLSYLLDKSSPYQVLTPDILYIALSQMLSWIFLAQKLQKAYV